MPGVVQISPLGIEGDSYRVRIAYQSEAERFEALAAIPRLMTPEDEEGIRWYLEEYLLFPFDPAPAIAASMEQRIQAIGAELFRALFEGSGEAMQIWLRLRSSLAQTRFEIASWSGEAIPWEFLRNPLDPVPIACRAQAFLRTIGAERDTVEPRQHDRVRVLVVIARPGGAADVRFRSVAARVLNQVQHRGIFEFDVLRPPTFDALAQRLQSAQTRGKPYTILHFDGHGIYDDLLAKHMNRPPKRKRGYLLFEDAENPARSDPVDGMRFAGLLADYGVPIVMLNACRSARSELAATPGAEPAAGAVRSFGSLAEELIGAGAGAVVAMQYNIYVQTAAQFVAAVYDELGQGEALADAVTHARRGLFEDPSRNSASARRDLQDWMVPVLYQAQPIALDVVPADGAGDSAVDLSGLPPSPPSGFVGRDDPLLELDRTFRGASIVLCWGLVGSGKTALAVEFARWLAQTGGTGAVLFTSFRERLSPARLIDSALAAFRQDIQNRGIEWLALSDDQRSQLLLDLLRTKQPLWVWDNVDTIRADAAGVTAWPAEEITGLASFLAQAATTGTKVLLTARTEHLDWLGDLVTPLKLPPMDMAERVQLAEAIVGESFASGAEEWLPLLTLSQGNPFVLSLLVRQAVTRGPGSLAADVGFLEAAPSGPDTQLFDASVAYTLRNEFTAEEQTVLALCSLFQGAVSAATLDFLLGNVDLSEPADHPNPGARRCAPALEHAARAGVLASLGSGYYSIHPGLPIHFQDIFAERFSAEEASLLVRRFVWLHGAISRTFARHYRSGEWQAADVSVRTLEINEPNLRYSLAVASDNGLWSDEITIVQGLRVLLEHAGRWPELARLIEEITVDFIDPDTGQALPGRESAWPTIQEQRVALMQHAHRLNEAERLQREIVRRRAAILQPAADTPGNEEGSDQTDLALSLQRLAGIQQERGEAECLHTCQEALEIAQRTNNTQLERDLAYQMASAYMQPEFLDLTSADYWLTYALDITPQGDGIGRGMILAALGDYALLQAYGVDNPVEGRGYWLEEAIRRLETALQILPVDMALKRSACQAQLGLAYYQKNREVPRTVQTLEQALAVYEAAGAAHDASRTRLSLAKVFAAAGDRGRARVFGEAALLSFARLAPGAEEDLVATQDFLERLQAPIGALQEERGTI